MSATKYKFGMIGLGTMGRNLLLNMADHGFAVAGYDKDAGKLLLLEKEGAGKEVKAFASIDDFVNSLETPRAIIMLVPAGKVVDMVIDEIEPLLTKGDILIDGGNSYFTDTNRRAEILEKKGLHFFGMGISGGEEGARFGPSMMPGGDKLAYEIMRPVFEAIAAKVNGEPCVTYVGPGSAGHFVKMAHNGIEYAIMQLIAETYAIMKDGLKLSNEEMHQVFAEWNRGRLQSFLVEITAEILQFKDPETGGLLVDQIKDEARAKGTGKWTSQVAMDLESPVPAIDTAVAMRDLSKYKQLRTKAESLYKKSATAFGDKVEVLAELEASLYFSMIITYSQGLHLLQKASTDYSYNINIADIVKIWRGGCIIRSLLLNDIYAAYSGDQKLEHLVLDEQIRKKIVELEGSARKTVCHAIGSALAVPCLASTLTYFDALTTGRMPSNLIQAQRDLFGAHTYELIGKEGVFHTEWK